MFCVFNEYRHHLGRELSQTRIAVLCHVMKVKSWRRYSDVVNELMPTLQISRPTAYRIMLELRQANLIEHDELQGTMRYAS